METKLNNFKVYKLYKNTGRRTLIRKNLTEAEAQQVVKSYRTTKNSMVIYTK